MLTTRALQQTFGIGLTGGIACGKSTIASLIAAEGVPVIDADQLARDAVAPGSPGLATVVATFGSDVLAHDQSLDRRKLRGIVMADAAKRRSLEAILHPAIEVLLGARLMSLGLTTMPRLWVYEASLLFETGTASRYREIWVAHCPHPLQVARLMARDHIDAATAEQIIANQSPSELKVSRADRAFATEASESALKTSVHEALAAVKAKLSQT